MQVSDHFMVKDVGNGDCTPSLRRSAHCSYNEQSVSVGVSLSRRDTASIIAHLPRSGSSYDALCGW